MLLPTVLAADSPCPASLSSTGHPSQHAVFMCMFMCTWTGCSRTPGSSARGEVAPATSGFQCGIATHALRLFPRVLHFFCCVCLQAVTHKGGTEQMIEAARKQPAELAKAIQQPIIKATTDSSSSRSGSGIGGKQLLSSLKVELDSSMQQIKVRVLPGPWLSYRQGRAGQEETRSFNTGTSGTWNMTGFKFSSGCCVLAHVSSSGSWDFGFLNSQSQLWLCVMYPSTCLQALCRGDDRILGVVLLSVRAIAENPESSRCTVFVCRPCQPAQLGDSGAAAQAGRRS